MGAVAILWLGSRLGLGLVAAGLLDAGVRNSGQGTASPTLPPLTQPPTPIGWAVERPAEATLIDEVVARVNRQPITLSQLRVEARLALAQHGELWQAEGPLPSPALAAALGYLVDQLLLENEAERLQIFETSQADSRAEVAAFLARFPTPTDGQRFLSRFGISTPMLQEALNRGLRGRRYLDDRVQSEVSRLGVQSAARQLISQLRARAELEWLVDFGPVAGEDAGEPEGQLSTPAAAVAP